MVDKVLVAAPTYDGKHYIFPTWYNIITKLDYPNYDWLIVDNSKGDSYSTKLRRAGFKKIIHVPRGGNSRLGIARASEYIRQYAVKNGYDYLLFIETDLLTPKDIIWRLLAHQKTVVGATYEIGLRGSKESPRRPIYYEKIKRDDGLFKIDMIPVEEAYKMVGTGLQKVKACGFGCTLIHKSILKQFPFKYNSKGKLHSDMLFYWELDNANEEVWVDTNLVIPHYNENWINVKDW